MNTLTCLGCKEELFEEGFLCDSCFEDLVKIQSLEKLHHEGALLYTLFFYTGIIESLIHQMKFLGRPYLYQVFAKYIITFLEKANLAPKSVSYVPMHSLKKLIRGFDPMELIAREVARSLDVPLVKAVKRVKYTKSLFKLKPKERQKTLEGAFEVFEEYEGPLLIIDDIFTTGSTLGSIGKELFEKDREDFFYIVIAKAWKKM